MVQLVPVSEGVFHLLWALFEPHPAPHDGADGGPGLKKQKTKKDETKQKEKKKDKKTTGQQTDRVRPSARQLLIGN